MARLLKEILNTLLQGEEMLGMVEPVWRTNHYSARISSVKQSVTLKLKGTSLAKTMRRLIPTYEGKRSATEIDNYISRVRDYLTVDPDVAGTYPVQVNIPQRRVRRRNSPPPIIIKEEL